MGEADGVPFSAKFEGANTNIHFRPQERSISMKNIISILFVALVFAAVSLAAQEQATTSPSAPPAVANPTVAANSGVTSEPVATSAEVATTPELATEPRAKGGADSENKPVPEGDPNASQNLIEYGGPG